MSLSLRLPTHSLLRAGGECVRVRPNALECACECAGDTETMDDRRGRPIAPTDVTDARGRSEMDRDSEDAEETPVLALEWR